MQTEDLQSLTPLRGIAAIWVICFHYAVVYFAFRLEQLSAIFNKGYLAVDMFFILSGFVLSHVYWRSFASDQSFNAGSYWRFIGARIARLYPLHLFYLFQFLVAALAFGLYQYISAGKFSPIPIRGARSLTALVANLAMVQGLKASELSWNFPAWSISVEFLAYFLFPFTLSLITQGDRRKWLLVGVAVSALCLFAYLSGGDFNQWNGPITLLRCLPEFIFGTLLYAGFRESLWPDWFKWDYALITIGGGVIVFLHFGIPDLLVVAGFPVLILSAVMNAGRVAPLLNSAPLVWLGNISYSLYLAHGFVQFLTTKLLVSSGFQDVTTLSSASAACLLITMLGATLAMATVTYRQVEIVGRSRLRQLLRGREQSLANEFHSTRTTDIAGFNWPAE
jgi:peptidoglycan/LPS O-acetylase OafA/YrhL